MLFAVGLLATGWAMGGVPTEAAPFADAAPAETDAEPIPDTVSPGLEKGFVSQRLDSGMLVSVYTVPELPVVATQTWVHIGAAHESPEEQGFAHLFEHLMFESTANVEMGDYARHHTIHAGHQNAYTSIDHTIYVSTIVPEGHDRVLELEADRLANLVVTEENLEREKKVVLEELRTNLEEQRWRGPLAAPILNALFEGHPYDHQTIGTVATIEAANLDLVQRFYDGYYHPANIHLVIVGPVDGPTTLAHVEALYGAIHKTHLEPPEVPALTEHVFPQRLVIRAPVPQAKYVGQLYMGPREGHPDHAAFTMMLHMLAHIEESPLEKVLFPKPGRRGAAWIRTYRYAAGPVLQMTSRQPVNRRMAKALRLLDDAVEQVGEEDWLSEAHLAASRRYMLLAELDDAWSAASLANRIGMTHHRWGDAHRGLEGEAPALRGVTLEQVQAVWQTWVLDVDPVEVVVKPGRTFRVIHAGGDQ